MLKLTSLLASAAAAVLLSTSVMAAEGGPGSPAAATMGAGAHGGDWVPYNELTLEKARKHAHERADKLDKMSESEWEQHKKEVMEKRQNRKGSRYGKMRDMQQQGGAAMTAPAK